MPTAALIKTPTPAPAKPAKLRVSENLLAYIKAMRTASAIGPDEAAEWVALEQEFTARSNGAKSI